MGARPLYWTGLCTVIQSRGQSSDIVLWGHLKSKVTHAHGLYFATIISDLCKIVTGISEQIELSLLNP